LAHPGKIHEIARGRKKTDHHDAFVLAEKLAKDEVPQAHRPTPRQRQHRALVRHRQHLKQSATALKNKMRRIAPHYNPDRKDLFTAAGWAALTEVKLSGADRFVLDQLHAQWRHLEDQVLELAKRLKAFAVEAPKKEAEARAKLRTAPGIGPVTIDVIVSELGDVSRFHSAKGSAPTPGWCRACGRAPTSGRTCRSPRRARRSCGGRWWRRRGGRCGTARRGGGCTRGSASGPGGRRRSWRWRGGGCACCTPCCGTGPTTTSSWWAATRRRSGAGRAGRIEPDREGLRAERIIARGV